jgi:hypothetical protein
MLRGCDFVYYNDCFFLCRLGCVVPELFKRLWAGWEGGTIN